MCCDAGSPISGRKALPSRIGYVAWQHLAHIIGSLLRPRAVPSYGLNAPKERIVGLDILRGISTSAVFILHIALSIPQGLFFRSEGIIWRTVYWGNCLLECFFALSGFLIGGALLRYEKFDYIHMYNYAVDRATRILPAYYTVFLVLTIFTYLNCSSEINYSYIFFTQCWFDNLYFIGVAWTLSIEVLSYVLLPIIIYIAMFKMRIGKNTHMTIIFFCIGIILFESLLRFLVVLSVPDIHMDDAVRKQSHLRMDALCYGLIIVCLKQACPAVYRRLTCPAFFLAALCGMLAMVEWQHADLFIRNLPGERHKPLHALLDFTLSGLLAAALLPFCETVRLDSVHTAIRRVCAFFQHVARISYSLYLVHLPLIPLLVHAYAQLSSQNALLNHLLFGILLAIYITVCFLIADIMVTYVEHPAMQLRKKIRMKLHD